MIKKNQVTEYLEMLAEIAELNDAYKKFYEQLVKCMKLGIYEDSTVGVKTAEVLRFNTSKPGDEQNNFAEYVDRRKGRVTVITSQVKASLSYPLRHSSKTCARTFMRYPSWLTQWMNTPCTSSRSPTERS